MTKNISIVITIFLTFAAKLVHNQQATSNWKDVKHVRTNQLEALQSARNAPEVSQNQLNYYGLLKTNEGHFQRTLSKILKVRIPGTQGSKDVRDFISDEMSSLGWSVEEDAFEEDTVSGRVKFTNIIATLDPQAPRRMVLACHYDSKVTPTGFLGAIDSAVPCAQMINLAHTMKMDLDDQKRSGNSELTLQLIFFDGEEAFVQWTATDSIYGARHLASKWNDEEYVYNRISGNTLDRIDIFVLLDLLGAKNPQIISSQHDTDPWFRKFVQIENGFGTKIGTGPKIFSTIPSRHLGIEDDHIPFLQRNVPILHLIPVPFPKAWHTMDDNENVVDYPTVKKLNAIMRVFVSDYLELA